MSHSLSSVAELAVKYVNTTKANIFLTGKAGSGKTTLLKYIVENTFKNTIVAAPTGIAAINAGGVTLHSLLQLPFGTFIPENIALQEQSFGERINTPHSVISEMQMGANKRNLLKEVELMIIDEVSMLRADLLDCIDLILRHIRKKSEPFGGLQILFIGDLNQLPPVVKNAEWPLLSHYYKSAYFFESRVLKDSPPIFVELDKIYRQSDQEFVDILNRLRDNKLINQDIETLNSHYKKNFSPATDEGYIHITTHNRKSDAINKVELGKLNTTPYDYDAIISGDFPENMYPLPKTTTFKEGAQVMFIKNDPSGEGQFYNGKIGQIISLSQDHIDVLLQNPRKVVHVETYKWENKRYKLNAATNDVEENIIGSFEQYPIKLAWAITVHKSQGLTFEKAILDLTDSFAPGQMYVALSRLTALKGLVLSTPIPNKDFELDNSLYDFTKSKKEYNTLKEDLKHHRKDFLLSYIERSFNFTDLLQELKYHLKSFNKDENRSLKQKYQEWTQELLQETEPLNEIVEKFIRQLRSITKNDPENALNILGERIVKAKDYFRPLLEDISEKIKTHRTSLGKKQQVKTYIKELKQLEFLYKKQIQQIEKAQLLVLHAADNKIPTKTDLLPGRTSGNGANKLNQKKSPTKEITLNLYKEGKSIEEIARERGLAYTTIEGHLAACIANGDIKVTDLVPEKKINQVLTVANTLETTVLNEIKERLGDEFSYGDIKMAMAYKRSMDKGGEIPNNHPATS